VFNWLLAGLNRLIEQGKFTESEKADKALVEFRRQSDSVALFVDEQGYSTSKDNKEALTDLYAEYKKFCSEDGYKATGKNKFSNRLENKGFERTRLGGGAAAFFIGKNEA
jgi:putative DNA primase/helicase